MVSQFGFLPYSSGLLNKQTNKKKSKEKLYKLCVSDPFVSLKVMYCVMCIGFNTFSLEELSSP